MLLTDSFEVITKHVGIWLLQSFTRPPTPTPQGDIPWIVSPFVTGSNGWEILDPIFYGERNSSKER